LDLDRELREGANRLLQVVLERLRKAFRQTVERGQGRRFARTFSSARSKRSRAATITKASSSP
jgi:hypothetical protein